MTGECHPPQNLIIDYHWLWLDHIIIVSITNTNGKHFIALIFIFYIALLWVCVLGIMLCVYPVH